MTQHTQDPLTEGVFKDLLTAIKQRIEKKTIAHDAQVKKELQKASNHVSVQRVTAKDSIMHDGDIHLNSHSDSMQSLLDKRAQILHEIQREILAFKSNFKQLQQQ